MSTLSFARVRCRPDQKHVRDFDSPSYKTVEIISVHGSEKEMAIMRHNFGATQPGGCQHPSTGARHQQQQRQRSELSVACAFRQSFSSDQGALAPHMRVA